MKENFFDLLTSPRTIKILWLACGWGLVAANFQPDDNISAIVLITIIFGVAALTATVATVAKKPSERFCWRSELKYIAEYVVIIALMWIENRVGPQWSALITNAALFILIARLAIFAIAPRHSQCNGAGSTDVCA